MTPSRCLIHWSFHIPSPAERAAAAQGGWQTHGRRRGSLPPARTRSKYVSVILLARRGRTGAGWEGFRQGPVLPGVRTGDPSPTQKVLEPHGGLPLSGDAIVRSFVRGKAVDCWGSQEHRYGGDSSPSGWFLGSPIQERTVSVNRVSPGSQV